MSVFYLANFTLPLKVKHVSNKVNVWMFDIIRALFSC